MGKSGCCSFTIEIVSLEETIKEVIKLRAKKASQTLDITVKIIKENKNLISYFVHNKLLLFITYCQVQNTQID